ncbi:MAG TPA: carbohydrate ABC transporter permease [Ktedonobacteraceae bacterium]|jgi:ABC-type glycerol-3-phosphate transport system permease component|nr:carbohydrate ABC transporter permease [Ktedonobacteraceae bacterium]
MVQSSIQPPLITRDEIRQIPRRRRMWQLHHPLWYIGYAVLILWAIMTIGPFVEMLLLSLKSNFGIYADPFGLTGFAPANYLVAWNGPLGQVGFVTYFVNTVEVAVLAVVFGVGFGVLAGYSLARTGGRLSNILFRLFALSLSIPLVVAVIPIYEMLENWQLLDTQIGIALVYGAFIVPTATVIMRSFFATFPKEMLEAATLDGCSELGLLWRIVLPLSKGGLVGVIILSLIYVWGEVQFAIVLLNSPESKTLAVGLLGFQGQFLTNEGALFAGLAMATVPILVAYLLLQRNITKGLTLGAFH